MATEKKAPKMQQIVHDDGRLEFKFSGVLPVPPDAPEGTEPSPIPEQVYSLSDFPQNVRDFFALFGMRTKLRNFTVPDADEGEASPEKMAEKLAKGANLLKQGLLRIAREPGEKRAGGTMLLEAAFRYKQLKAEAKGETYAGTEADVAKEIEDLTDEQTEQLKSTTLFKLAMAEVKEKRAAAKKATLLAQAAKEAAEADAPQA